MPDFDILESAQDALAVAPSIEIVSDVAKRAARALGNAQGATFVLADGDQCFYADEDAIAPLWRGMRFPMTACISGWAMMHHEQVAVPEVFLDSRIPWAAYSPTFVRGLLMTPVGSPPVAAIGVYWSEARTATADQADDVRALAASVARAIERIGIQNAPTEPWTLPPLSPA